MANGGATWKPSSFFGAGPLWAPALGAAAFWPGDLSGAAVAAGNAPCATAEPTPAATNAPLEKNLGDASTQVLLPPTPSPFNNQHAPCVALPLFNERLVD